MDLATFLERYGYTILLVVSLAVVVGLILVYPMVLIWKRFGASMVIYVVIMAFMFMGVYYVVKRGANLTTTTLGKAGYLNRTKYFESKEDVETEGISDRLEKGEI